jgi:lariat debranching enzyme
MKTFNIVVEGCVHGNLNRIYHEISCMNVPVDLVLLCGDFQAIRNSKDLNAMAVPPKYKQMGDFHLYYSGQKLAPYLTVFIGGNHESSSYLRELYYGGWVAPNIYYLGQAGVVNFNGLRIAGLSGIYNKMHYDYNHFERLPYNSGTERSIYHVRKNDVASLSLIRSGVDVMLSHDWPAGIAHFGNMGDLLKKKPFFKRDIDSGQLGSPPAFQLLKTLRPTKWFSSHLHVRFVAQVPHNIKTNEDEIELDFSEVDQESIKQGNVSGAENVGENVGDSWRPFAKPLADTTSFLALDKCLARRKFLEHVRIDAEVPSEKRKRDENENSETANGKDETNEGRGLFYDAEWLAIVRVMNNHLSMGPAARTELPKDDELCRQVDKELQWVKQNIVDQGRLAIPENFKILADHYSTSTYEQPDATPSNQTEDFCNLLQIENKIVS